MQEQERFNKLFNIALEILDNSPEVKIHISERRLLAGRFASRFIRYLPPNKQNSGELLRPVSLELDESE